MKKTILFLFIMMSFFIVKAQKQDTNIYQSCRLAKDPVHLDDKGIFFDSCPQFKNGLDDLYKYIAAHTRYPTRSKEKDVKERAILSIIIEKDGSVSHAKIER